MRAGQSIRQAVERISELRELQARQEGLASAVTSVKSLQARRFAGTYPDLLDSPRYGPAARFFLEELYSDRDFADRDAQFARIAGAIEKFFPAAVAQTAVDLAQLHALTELLDHEMALHWQSGPPAETGAARYIRCWRAAGRRSDREAQLRDVLTIGEEMARLTRTPGLRTMLKMMRRPATASGLGALQKFLEAGFDTFAALAREGHVRDFLKTVCDRESSLMAALFDASPVACETTLSRILGQAP